MDVSAIFLIFISHHIKQTGYDLNATITGSTQIVFINLLALAIRHRYF